MVCKVDIEMGLPAAGSSYVEPPTAASRSTAAANALSSAAAVAADEVGMYMYKLRAAAPYIGSAWFQPLRL